MQGVRGSSPLPPTTAWPRRSRRGTPYPAPSKEGALRLFEILAAAWSLKYQNGAAAEAHPTRPPQKRGALPLYKISATAWSLKYPKYFTLIRRGRRGTPYLAPSKEGALPLHKISATAWSLKYPKYFTLIRRGRRGSPYPAPSFEGAFTFVQNLSDCLESKSSKRRGRKGSQVFRAPAKQQGEILGGPATVKRFWWEFYEFVNCDLV